MPLETFDCDWAELLDSEEAIAEYLTLASADGTPKLIARAWCGR